MGPRCAEVTRLRLHAHVDVGARGRDSDSGSGHPPSGWTVLEEMLTASLFPEADTIEASVS